jgi:hypothetical protein
MDEEQLQKFANQLDADPEKVMDRWQGRPDLIIDDLFRIQDQDTGKVRDLELFDVQRKLVHGYFYSDAGTVNAYKGRRIGYSFAVVACFLLESLFYPDSFYPVVSRSWSQAKNRISDIQDLIDNAKIEIPTKKENADYIELWNGSSFQAYSADADTSRGDDSARAVLLDEMAFIENQKETMRAFDAFLALGENRKMVEVSTPNTKNDLFMQEHKRGSEDGDGSVLAIKQPTFDNAEEIDVHKPLTDQHVEPVRPEINVERLESNRMADPEGFGQEYLCRPVVDEYRFFDEATIEEAQARGAEDKYQIGLDAVKPNGARRVLGVDIGISEDDTVLSVMDHINGRREQKALIVADDDVLREAGVANPDRANANHIATLIAYVHQNMDVDLVILDKGGPGETFERIVERKLGRGVVGFNFSDKEAVSDMMGDTNICLREGQMALVPDDRLFDELGSIVKEKRDHYAKPKFSGKEQSETGKDDTAMATVLSAFPPNNTAEPATSPAARERASVSPTEPETHEPKEDGNYNPSYGSTAVNRTSRTRKNTYSNRRTRGR